MADEANTPRCPGPLCPMCAGSVCGLCESRGNDRGEPCEHSTAERHQTRPIVDRNTARVVRGGIELKRDVLGNVTITARGNGQCHVQAADVYDLAAALVDLLAKR